MAGIHGKNASIRVSTSETVISGVEMAGVVNGTPTVGTAINGGYAQIVSASQRNWKYDPRTLIQFNTSTTTGDQVLARINAAGTGSTDIGTQTRLINYAGGAIHLGQYPDVASGVFAMAVSMTLTEVGNLVGDARNFTVTVTTDTVDSTVIGDVWRSYEDGILGFEGSLDGLHIDNFWYKQAVSTLSGLTPRVVLRMQLDPKNINSYYQGTVIFPSFELSGGYDALIERSVEFQGRGPLDLVENGRPFFKVHETTT